MIVIYLMMLLFCFGLGLVWFVSWRRRIPDLSNPEVFEKCRYHDVLRPGVEWLLKQNLEPVEAVSYDGLRLRGVLLHCENARGTVLEFHGYRSSWLNDFSASAEYYQSLGYNLLLCDQRAHGKSEGTFITFGVRERYDVQTWVKYLSGRFGKDHPIFPAGISMGAATVLMAANLPFDGNVRGILADCGYTSPGDIIRYLIKFRFHLPVKLTAGFLNLFTTAFGGYGLDQWSTERALAETQLPILLCHGLEDRFVPPEMSRRAYEACKGQVTLEEFPGAHHGTSYLKDKSRYQAVLKEFLEKHTP